MGTLGAVRFLHFFALPLPEHVLPPAPSPRHLPGPAGSPRNKLCTLSPQLRARPPRPRPWPGPARSLAHLWVHFLSVYFFSVYTRSTPVDIREVFESPNFWRPLRPSSPFLLSNKKTPFGRHCYLPPLPPPQARPPLPLPPPPQPHWQPCNQCVRPYYREYT